MAKLKITASPLVEWVERRGGVTEVLETKGISILSSEGERLKKNYNRSKKRGWFDVFFADDFTVRFFKQHPSAVFGSDWYAAAAN